MDEIDYAEQCIIKYIQFVSFPDVVNILSRSKFLCRNPLLAKLNPCIPHCFTSESASGTSGRDKSMGHKSRV